MIALLRSTGITFGALGVLIDFMVFPMRLYQGAGSPISMFFASVTIVFVLIATLCIMISLRIEKDRERGARWLCRQDPKFWRVF